MKLKLGTLLLLNQQLGNHNNNSPQKVQQQQGWQASPPKGNSLKSFMDIQSEQIAQEKKRREKIQVKNLRDIQREELLKNFEAGNEDEVLKEVIRISLEEHHLGSSV